MLQPGELVRIGHSQMAFVHELASAFPDPATSTAPKGIVKTDETILGTALEDSDVLSRKQRKLRIGAGRRDF